MWMIEKPVCELLTTASFMDASTRSWLRNQQALLAVDKINGFYGHLIFEIQSLGSMAYDQFK